MNKTKEKRKNQIQKGRCVSMAQKRHTKYLSKKLLEKSIEIPIDGYRVIEQDGNIVNIVPFIQGKISREEYDRLGTYNISEDMVAILSNDGKTYIMRKIPNIVGAMDEIGYRRDYRLVVPMSNGEKFLDEQIQERFESL